jgi:hypothetical protein
MDNIKRGNVKIEMFTIILYESELQSCKSIEGFIS